MKSKLSVIAKQMLREGLTDDQEFRQLLGSLAKHLISRLGIKEVPQVILINNDVQNADDMLGRTGFYNHNKKSISLFTYGRHPKDILRTFAHEMIHHKQNQDGRLRHQITTQNVNEDEYLKQIEMEAYRDGNLLFREWENGLD